MNIALRVLPARESEDEFVVSAASTDGVYPASVRTLPAEVLLRLLDSLQLEQDYLAVCRAHVEAGMPSLVLTDSDAFEEAVAALGDEHWKAVE